MSYWIKLWTEILDDPKMGQLPDHLWRRVVEMFLFAGKLDATGLLPPVQDMAWTLHTTPDALAADLEELASLPRPILAKNEDGWIVCQFDDRQSPVSNAERQQRHRDKSRRSNEDVTNRDNSVTKNVTTSNGTTVTYTEAEAEAEADQIQNQKQNSSTFIPEVLLPVEAQPATLPGEKPPKKAKSPPGNGHSPAMMFTALAAAYRMDTALLTERDRGRLNATTKRLTAAGYTADEIADAGQFWWAEDWRGKKGSPPTDSQFFQVIAQRKAFRAANQPLQIVEIPCQG